MKDVGILQGHYPDLVLYLHLTMDCNLRCAYCYGGEKRPEHMPLEIAQRAVDYFLDRTDRLKVRFFGGEPLLQFSLLKEIVAYCKESARKRNKRIEYAAVTNGVLLTEEVASYCGHNHIDYSVSFDGNREAQDANRLFPSGTGSFEILEKNMPHFLRWNPYVHIVRVVSPNNVAVLSDSVRFLLEKGFCNISMSPDYTHAHFKESLPVLKNEYYKMADLYLEHLKKTRRVFINVFDHIQSIFRRGPCRFGRRDFSVDVNGDIYPCCCFVDHKVYRLGNIDRGPDAEQCDLFLTDSARLQRHMEEDHRDCPETSFCKIGCGCTNMVTSRKLYVTDPVICEYGRVEAEVRQYVSDRLAGK